MNPRVLGRACVILAIGTAGLACRQQEQPDRQDSTPDGMPMQHGMMMENMQRHMQMMDSMDARLDTLVSRMNRATGEARVTAMAQVINEMVSHRKQMQEHMRQMMDRRRDMMGQDRMGPNKRMRGRGPDSAGNRMGRP